MQGMRGLPRCPRVRGLMLVLLLPMLVSSAASAGLAQAGPPEPMVFTVQPAQRASSPQGCVAGRTPHVAQHAPITAVKAVRGMPAEAALTFDDGPSPTYTPQILAALHAAGAHATFFVIGGHAARYPTLVRAEWAGGNAIGNHTYNHSSVPKMTRAQLRKSIAATSAAVRTATGDSCLWLFRPPYGALTWNSADASELRQEGLTIVDWSIDPNDWKRPGANVIAQRVIRQLRPGAIILMHDGAPDWENGNRSQTVAALRQIMAAMRARGLKSVTLPQLFHDAHLTT